VSAEERDLLVETVERAFGGLAAETPPDDENSDVASRWARVEEIGIGDLMVPQSAGGFGGSFQDLIAVLHSAGRHAIALPIGETILVRALLAASAIQPAAGAASFGVCAGAPLMPSKGGSGSEFSGVLDAVPWGRAVESVITIAPHREHPLIIHLATRQARRRRDAVSASGEARDSLEFERAPIRAFAPLERPPDLIRLGALMRVAQMAGAIEAALTLAIEHARERNQFGRRLSEFQVIQHQLAVFAEESAAVNCAAVAAARAVDLGDGEFEIAAAKLRANRAAGLATQVAHQIHGAMGCTREHRLQRLTRRLWSWRSEFGNDRYWALELGRQVTRTGADAMWAMMAERGDRRAAPSSR
jgi:acyl-CoA dehydrogenase